MSQKNVRFQVEICPERCQLDQIQNDPLKANIGKLCQIARPLSTTKQKVWFQGGMCPNKCEL